MSDDIISRSALLEKIQFRIHNDRVLTDIVDSCVKITRRIIEEAPAVDVKDLIEYHIDENARTVGYRVVDESHTVPVVHGRWERAFNLKPTCSVCGEYHLYSWSDHKRCNYCPNCGAKMDGGEDNG